MTKGFEELFAFSKFHGAKDLVIGGHAVAFHAKPRFTKDIQLFIELSAQTSRASPPEGTSVLEANTVHPSRL